MFVEAVQFILVLSAVVQLFFISYFLRCAIIRPKTKSDSTRHASVPVSIIICALNESKNIPKFLPFVLNQDYKDQEGHTLFEVIVVNDHSSDDTATQINILKQQYPHLSLVDLDTADKSGKKYALQQGVLHSRHGLLLFTDADCQPVGNLWIHKMIAPLLAGKEIVASYAPYFPDASFINNWQHCETIHGFMQGNAAYRLGVPYMAVGRNMACTKAVFLKAVATELYNSLPYGDDDLLVRICGNATNMETLTDPDSFVFSDVKKTWKSWLQQKQRHVSTGKYYKPAIKLLMGAYASSHFATWLCFVILLFQHVNMYCIVGLMVLRALLFNLALARTAITLKEKSQPFMFFIFDFGWLIYNFALSPYIFWKNKKQWK